MKKFCIALCLILLVSMLAACSERVGNQSEDDAPSGNNTPHNTADNPSGTSDTSRNTDNTSPGLSTLNERGSLSERLIMDLGNNIIVDATVSTPDAGNLNVRQIVPHIFDVTTARRLLLGENYWVDDSMPIVEGVTFHANGTNNFIHDVWGLHESISLSPVYCENPVSTLVITEPTEGDLEFMSRDEAAQIVLDLLQNIGITALPTSILSLDYETIRTTVAFTNQVFGTELPHYTSFSESYIIEFTQIFDGVSVYSGQYRIELRAGTEMTPSVVGAVPWIRAIVTEAGIVNLNVGSIFNHVSAEPQVTELISLEQAIETVRQSFENIINVETLFIDYIELVYVILPKSLQELDSFEAWPTWVFRTAQEVTISGSRGGHDITHRQERAIFVCAIDGIILRDRFR